MKSFGRYKIVDMSLRNLNGKDNDLIVLEQDYGDKNPSCVEIAVSSLPSFTDGFNTIKIGDVFDLQLVPVKDKKLGAEMSEMWFENGQVFEVKENNINCFAAVYDSRNNQLGCRLELDFLF